jgi:hypothetical protein
MVKFPQTPSASCRSTPSPDEPLIKVGLLPCGGVTDQTVWAQ